MKAKIILKYGALLVFFFQTIFLHAQQIKPCGPYTINKAEFKKALDYENQHAAKFAQSGPTVIRVFFHICEPNQILFTDVSESQINLEFKHLVGAYSSANICFVNAGFDYIYNTALDTFNFSTDNKNIFLSYGIQNCITVFYITTLHGTNSSSGGGASGITFGPLPTAWTIVEKDYIGKGVLEHEAGHCFGLLHTFDFKNGNGLEDIDGSNGSTSADLIADTRADPYAYNYEDPLPCFSGTCSTYTGTCTDPKQQTNFSPPYNNKMSYWCGFLYPTGQFTSGQYSRVNSFLNTASVLQVTESQSTVTESNETITAGFHMNSAITTLTTSGTVVLSNTVMATLGAGQTVFLEPGFHAAPVSGGRIFIRHAFCDTSSNGFSIASTMQTSSENKNAEDKNPGKLFAYPNPASSTIHFVFNTIANENNVVIQIYNMNMQPVKEFRIKNILPGKQNITENLNGLSSGMYYIIVHLESKQLTAKISIIH
jgi:Secretion system C-terminal sorting domain